MEAVRLLVRYGATFEASEALKIAASFSQLNMVGYLVDLGADENHVCGLKDPENTSRCEGGTAPFMRRLMMVTNS